jgi:2'-5' RNA ligase
VNPLYTICLPDMSEASREWVESLRHLHDRKSAEMLGAHFTLVFGCATVSSQDQIEHVRSVARHFDPIEFHCRRTLPISDEFHGSAHVFLVPEEGHSDIEKLHDHLYGGVLAPCLRQDIPFIPHITLGKFDDLDTAQRQCNEFNRQGLHIAGTLRTLLVGAVEDGRFKLDAAIPLGRC